jgi:microcystin-dependent protein
VSTPYIGEIRIFAGNFAPAGWALCEGQLLAIANNDALFNLIGTTYGGDGQQTFALPDLRGRLPLHQGNGFTLAQQGGTEQETLTVNTIPAHSHPLQVTADVGTQSNPDSQLLAQLPPATAKLYRLPPQPFTPQNLAASTITTTGGSQPHSNFQPYLCVNFIISLYGIFPSQN